MLKAEESLQKRVSSASLSGSRLADFMMAGGLSLIVWLVVMIGDERWSWVGASTALFPAAAWHLANFVNHPHFMISYKLGYMRGPGFIARNWWQLVLVPFLLLIIPVVGFVYGNQTPETGSVARFLNPLYSLLGARMEVARYATLAPATLSLLITAMYFTVGWHYSKQAFGAMMVFGQLDGYVLLPWQRLIVRYSLLSTWWTTWIWGQVSETPYKFYSLTLYRLNLPRFIYFGSLTLTWSLAAAFWLAVVLGNWRRTKRLPSANYLVPWVALFIWHIPAFYHPEFFYVIALFHSLQYMPFVAKIEKNRLREQRGAHYVWSWLAIIAVAMIGTGYLSFHFIPKKLDPLLGTAARFGVEYVLIATLAFINIHHYFIDNVIWRFKDPRVKDWLLA